jgi:hypothetical protein
MRRCLLPSLAALLILSTVSAPGRAAELVAPPLIYPADTWQGRSIATVRVLDGLDSHVQSLTIPVGQDVTYKALTIHVGACRDRPATLVPDAAGWLAVRDTRQDGPGFSGWMLAGEPFLGVFQDPVYTVQLVGCSGDMTAPIPAPLTAVADTGAQAGTPVPADQAASGTTSQGGASQGAIQTTVPQPSSSSAQPSGAPGSAATPPATLPSATPVATAPSATPAPPAAGAGAPLSLSPDAPAPGSGSPPAVSGTATSTPVVAPSGIAGQHRPLPPPVPYGAAGDGGAAPLSLLPPPAPPMAPPMASSVAPATVSPGGSPGNPLQPGQPQSLLPP